MKSVFIFLLIFFPLFVCSQSYTINANYWEPDGVVNDIEVDTVYNRLYVGGFFRYVGPSKEYGIVLKNNETNMESDSPNNIVHTSVPDGNGGWYIGGEFTRVGDSIRNRIAHIDSLGKVIDNLGANGFDSTVYSLHLIDSTLYAGGDFISYGQTRKFGALFSRSNGDLITSFPVTNGMINTSISDGAGGWYLGGNFSQIGDSLRQSLAHVDEFGNVTAWNPEFAQGSVILSLKLKNDQLFVGGNFNTVAGISRPYLASINSLSGAVNPFVLPIDSYVSSLEILGDTLYFGGNFQFVDGESRIYLASVNINSNVLTDWAPNPDTGVYCLLADSSSIFVAGPFISISGQSRKSIAKYNRNDLSLNSWNANINNSVFSIGVKGNTLYFGGAFTSVNSVVRNRIASIDKNSAVLSGWNPNIDNWVNKIAILDTTIIAVGNFTYSNSENKNRYVELDLVTGLNLPVEINSNGSISNVSVWNDKVFVGGNINKLGYKVRYRIASLNVNTTKLSNWKPDANSTVRAIVSNSNKLFVGGSFTYIADSSRHRIASFDLISGAIDGINISANNIVYCLEAKDSLLFLGGMFSTLGGVTRNRIASYNVNSQSLRSWNPNCIGTIYTMDLDQDNLYVGGTLTSISGISRSRMAAIDITNGNLLSWNPIITWTLSPRIEYIQVKNDQVYLGGQFLTVNGFRVRNLASVNKIDGTVDSTFKSADNVVRCITFSNNSIFVGGEFKSGGGEARNHLAAYDLTTGALLPFSPEIVGSVNVIKVKNSELYLGGGISSINGETRYHFASLDRMSGTVQPWAPNIDDKVTAIEFHNDTIFIGGSFLNVNGAPRSRIASFNSVNGELLNWNPIISGSVFKIEKLGAKLFVAGLYLTVNGESRQKICSFDLPSGELNSWNPIINSTIHDIQVKDSSVYAFGIFYEVNGEPQEGIVQLDTITGNHGQLKLQRSGQAIAGFIGDNTIYAAGTLFSNEDQPLVVKIMELNKINGDSVSAFYAIQNIGGGVTTHRINKHQSHLFIGGDFTSFDGDLIRNFVVLNICETELNENYENVSACESYVWPQNNQFYNSSGLYTHNLINVEGCDSIVVLNLTILNDSTNDVLTACDSLTWIDGITYYASTNSPTWTLTNASGCDSVVTLNLTIMNSTSGIDFQTSCDSLTWIDGITYYASTNSPTWILTNVEGCDSVLTLNLTILNSSLSVDDQIACEAFTWIDGNTYYESTNTPTWTFTNASGCDSLVTLELVILPQETTVINNQFSLPSDPVSCNGQYAIEVSGNEEFMLSADGDAEVQTTNGIYIYQDLCPGIHDLRVINNCSDTNYLQFIIPIDTNYIFNNNFIDSLAQDSLGILLENCELYYNSIDTAYIDSLWSVGNTVYVIWNIVDSSGFNYDTTSYELNNGSGVYYLQLSIFCPTKELGDYFTVTQAVFFDSDVTNLNELFQDCFYLFPNPTSDNISLISVKDAFNYSIFDSFGRLILSDYDVTNKTVSLTSFDDGIYYVIVEMLSKSKTFRVVKIK